MMALFDRRRALQKKDAKNSQILRNKQTVMATEEKLLKIGKSPLTTLELRNALISEKIAKTPAEADKLISSLQRGYHTVKEGSFWKGTKEKSYRSYELIGQIGEDGKIRYKIAKVPEELP